VVLAYQRESLRTAYPFRGRCYCSSEEAVAGLVAAALARPWPRKRPDPQDRLPCIFWVLYLVQALHSIVFIPVVTVEPHVEQTNSIRIARNHLWAFLALQISTQLDFSYSSLCRTAQYFAFRPFGGRGVLLMKSTQSFTLLPGLCQLCSLRVTHEHTYERRPPPIINLLTDRAIQARSSRMVVKVR